MLVTVDQRSQRMLWNFSLCPCFSQCGLWAGSLSCTWDLVRDVESQAPPWPWIHWTICEALPCRAQHIGSGSPWFRHFRKRDTLFVLMEKDKRLILAVCLLLFFSSIPNLMTSSVNQVIINDEKGNWVKVASSHFGNLISV